MLYFVLETKAMFWSPTTSNLCKFVSVSHIFASFFFLSFLVTDNIFHWLLYFKKIRILDVGITTVHSESDHKLISDVLAAFIRCDGRKAGRSMIDDSNTRLESIGDHSVDAEKFIDRMEQLTIKAQGENYFMEHLGNYISHICQCAATHHVMINQAFISAALAVKVQEGIALALDPSIEIWKIAIPIIMEGERKHGRAAERAKEILGFDRFVGWLTGNKNDDDKKDKAKDH